MRNEQVLCGLDSSYWERNYAWVCNEKGEIIKFKNRLSQKIYDEVVASFDEKQVSIELLCLHPDTKVLTAELVWKRIDDLTVGESLVATDEGLTQSDYRKDNALRQRQLKSGIHRDRPKKMINRERKLRTAIVEAKWSTERTAFEVSFDDGRTIVASPEHKWLCKERGGSRMIWRETREICVGDEMRYVTKPWGESGYEDGWFGGFADGEGSMSGEKENGCELSVSQRKNCAYTRAEAYLKTRGYSYRIEVDDRKKGENSRLGNSPVAKLLVSRVDELFRLVGQTRPSRFISTRWWEGKSLPGKKTGAGISRVVSVRMLPTQRLVDIQTSTRTFLAEGFVSHNCLKGRQLGVTTKTALKFLHRMLFVPHTQAIMASVKQESSQLIERIINTAYENCPWWLVPNKGPKRTFDNGSVLSIQSGMQATGLAQGWTPTAVHLSELADIPDPEKTIEEGLFRAAHSSKNLFMVLEGTGGGNTGWLADTWRDAKKKWPKGESRLFPMFIPWPMCPEIYPQDGWLRKFPIPEDFMSRRRSEALLRHVQRSEAYIRSTPYLARVAGANWTMPPQQQWYWQFNYEQACGNHTQRIWLAQMPADDFESLTGKSDPVFEPEVIAEVENHVYELQGDQMTRKKPIKAYAIVGESIDDEFAPRDEEIDWDEEVIRVKWRSNRGTRYEWEMIPLRPVDEENEKSTMDKLLIYEPPIQGKDYSCGIDTAYGLGEEDEDRTVVSLWKNGHGAGYDEQAAELTSNRLNSAQVVPFAACIAAYYSTACKDWRGVKFAIEQIAGPGDTCQNQLKMMGFNYHHRPRRYDSKKVKDDSSRKEGWYSTGWSVPILMTRIIEAVNGGWIRPHSKWLIEEMKTLERHVVGGGKTKMEHRAGQHDDRVRAMAQAFFTVHDLDDLAERAQKRYAPPKRKSRNGGETCCKSNLVSVGEWED